MLRWSDRVYGALFRFAPLGNPPSAGFRGGLICVKRQSRENGLLPQVGSGLGGTGDENVKIAAFAELEYVNRFGRKKKAPPPDIPNLGMSGGGAPVYTV